ncbi:MAG TPA: NAD(P)-dependent oxidoreductase [Caldilineae bacterium]|nr:NAD(P)-dependent oxidoreductase [Caldilineae bacterium]
MKIAITGGAGFLGLHLANRLASQGIEVALLDIAKFNPAEYPDNVYNADVRNSAALQEAFKGADVVIHAAAALPLWRRKDIFDINVRGTRTVLEVARENGVERVIYISSTAVYGIPRKHPLYETDLLEGVGPYGESKIQAEKVCESFRSSGMCVPIVRPKTFIGTGRLGVFQILYDWVRSGKRIPIIGDGRNRYQLLEVEDLVDAIYLLATSPKEKVNDTFNVGAEKFNTVREDLGALCDFAGTGARVMGTPAWLVKPGLQLFEMLGLSPLYEWVYGTADKDSFVSIEKIKATLGWLPKYSNAAALIRSYQWYLDHHRELDQKTGITHRVAWDQGVLKMIKKLL